MALQEKWVEVIKVCNTRPLDCLLKSPQLAARYLSQGRICELTEQRRRRSSRQEQKLSTIGKDRKSISCK